MAAKWSLYSCTSEAIVHRENENLLSKQMKSASIAKWLLAASAATPPNHDDEWEQVEWKWTENHVRVFASVCVYASMA